MNTQEPKKKAASAAKKPESRCESCEFFDYDEYLDSYSCQMLLDEDEFADFAAGQTGRCPYYRFYDEYKSVQKQN